MLLIATKKKNATWNKKIGLPAGGGKLPVSINNSLPADTAGNYLS